MTFAFVEDVTSDLAFVARGASAEEVFASAAEALLAATVESPEKVGTTVARRVALTEPDLELLLLRFLNELIYLRDAERLLLRAARLHIEVAAAARLEGELSGEPIDRGRHRLLAEVKAATAHGLRVATTPEGYEARVTLDV